MEMEQEGASVAGGSEVKTEKPTVLIMMGLAASGKTTLVQRVTADLIAKGTPPYIVNLDPACISCPFPVNIDIRDTISASNLMKEHKLGPNGAIITALNLYSVNFNQVVDLLVEKGKNHKYILIDTPGQIEIFLWSASGQIITETLANTFPTIMMYVTDLLIAQNPISFVQTMTLATSILYKSQLPLAIVLNKCDEVDPKNVLNWMTDFEAIEDEIQKEEGYSASLASSLVLHLEELYKVIDTCVVSAKVGTGIPSLYDLTERCVKEYYEHFLPVYIAQRKEKEKEIVREIERQKRRLKRDAQVTTDSSSRLFSTLSLLDGGSGLTDRTFHVDEDSDSDNSTIIEDDEQEERNFNASFSKISRLEEMEEN